MTRTTTLAVAAAAAALFATGTIALVSSPAEAAVKCIGANACKGESACQTANSACKGLNACKGQGFTELPDAAACQAAGGKVG
ncbi:MAG TPA: hypothetical protein VF194_06960 [Ferrovibrio sp.]|uniref:BufA2 family periplasmic bufferin-type metallophore n=1 Tax=Ferrovibrio sp. TaxID=1917215 RepID=UPI002ED3723A